MFFLYRFSYRFVRRTDSRAAIFLLKSIIIIRVITYKYESVCRAGIFDTFYNLEDTLTLDIILHKLRTIADIEYKTTIFFFFLWYYE